MKKTILALLMSIVTLTPALAENTKFVDTGKPDRLISVGVHVADGVSTIRQNYPTQIGSVGSFTLTPGNSFAFGASAVLNISRFVGIGTAIDFSINNYYYNLTVLNDNGAAGTLTTLYSSNRFTSLDIPVYLQLRLNIGNRVSWANRVGFYLSKGLDGHSDYSTYRSSTNELGQSMVTHTTYRTDYFKADDGLLNRLSDTDYGIHLATGLTIYGHYDIGVALNVGLKNIASNFGVFDTKVRTLGALVKIGYQF